MLGLLGPTEVNGWRPDTAEFLGFSGASRGRRDCPRKPCWRRGRIELSVPDRTKIAGLWECR